MSSIRSVSRLPLVLVLTLSLLGVAACAGTGTTPANGADATAFVGVTRVAMTAPPGGERALSDPTVLVEGDRIVAVGPAAEVEVPVGDVQPRDGSTTGRRADFGSVGPGRRADLLLLGQNPLEEIAATRAVEAVMLRGRWLDRAALDTLLEQVERSVVPVAEDKSESRTEGLGIL